MFPPSLKGRRLGVRGLGQTQLPAIRHTPCARQDNAWVGECQTLFPSARKGMLTDF